MNVITRERIRIGKRAWAWAALVCMVPTMLAGCDVSAGIADQITTFVQDFARQTLAALLL